MKSREIAEAEHIAGEFDLGLQSRIAAHDVDHAFEVVRLSEGFNVDSAMLAKTIELNEDWLQRVLKCTATGEPPTLECLQQALELLDDKHGRVLSNKPAGESRKQWCHLHASNAHQVWRYLVQLAKRSPYSKSACVTRLKFLLCDLCPQTYKSSPAMRGMPLEDVDTDVADSARNAHLMYDSQEKADMRSDYTIAELDESPPLKRPRADTPVSCPSPAQVSTASSSSGKAVVATSLPSQNLLEGDEEGRAIVATSLPSQSQVEVDQDGIDKYMSRVEVFPPSDVLATLSVVSAVPPVDSPAQKKALREKKAANPKGKAKAKGKGKAKAKAKARPILPSLVVVSEVEDDKEFSATQIVQLMMDCGIEVPEVQHPNPGKVSVTLSFQRGCLVHMVKDRSADQPGVVQVQSKTPFTKAKIHLLKQLYLLGVSSVDLKRLKTTDAFQSLFHSEVVEVD